MTSHVVFSRSWDRWLGSQIRRAHSRTKSWEKQQEREQNAQDARQREEARDNFLKNMRRTKSPLDGQEGKE